MKLLCIRLAAFFGIITACFAADAENAYLDRDLGIAFPKSLASLAYIGKQQYGDPKLGYSVRYQNEEMAKVDIYIYDNGLTDIIDRGLSKRVRDEFADVLSIFPAMEKMGKYKGVTDLGRMVKSFGPSKWEYLWARFQYQQTPGEGVLYLGNRISNTYLTGFAGKFVKVRITLKSEDLKNWEEIEGRLMEEVTQLLERQRK